MVFDSVYKAEVLKMDQSEGDGSVYVGLHNRSFKARLANHELSFSKRTKINGSELAKFVWKLKDKGISDFKIIWNIISQETCYDRRSGKCNLCQKKT